MSKFTTRDFFFRIFYTPDVEKKNPEILKKGATLFQNLNNFSFDIEAVEIYKNFTPERT